jgi:hypothetical protein
VRSARSNRAGHEQYDLRHTHGTLLHSQGTPLKVAQAQLGHSHMATTLDIYTHASGSAQRDAVNLLEEQLFPNVPKLESCGSIAETESQLVQWSGRPDLNRGPPAPKAGALPGCATPRQLLALDSTALLDFPAIDLARTVHETVQINLSFPFAAVQPHRRVWMLSQAPVPKGSLLGSAKLVRIAAWRRGIRLNKCERELPNCGVGNCGKHSRTAPDLGPISTLLGGPINI